MARATKGSRWATRREFDAGPGDWRWRDEVQVVLPRAMLEEARHAVAGTGIKEERKGTAAAAIRFILEEYLISYGEGTLHRPTPRGQADEPAEVKVTIQLDEGQARLLDAFMRSWWERLKEAWLAVPKGERAHQRPRKPEYRGLVIAAIKEATTTGCFGWKRQEGRDGEA